MVWTSTPVTTAGRHNRLRRRLGCPSIAAPPQVENEATGDGGIKKAP